MIYPRVDVINMAMTWPILSSVVAILIVVLLAVFILKMRKSGWKRTIDYKNYFIMGVIWLPFGIAMALLYEGMSALGWFFAIMGLVYLAIGLVNRGKWGKPQKVTAGREKIMLAAVAVGIIIAALVVVTYMFLGAR